MNAEVNDALVVRRTIRATPEQLFSAWTQPEQLQSWFGPRGAKCTAASVDLRVGGEYRLENTFSDGRVVRICGTYEAIDPPRRLVFSWMIEAAASPSSRVIVDLIQRGDATEVIVTHEHIVDEEARKGHEAGWEQCLDGLWAMTLGSS